MSEASDFDRYDQSLAVPLSPELEDEDLESPDGFALPAEADPADALDQYRTVPVRDPDDDLDDGT